MTREITNLDLHTEQAKHAVLLEGVCVDVREIKGILIGNNDRVGVIVDIDRLKQTQKRFNTTFWAVFTVAIGTTGTVIAAYFFK